MQHSKQPREQHTVPAPQLEWLHVPAALHTSVVHASASTQSAFAQHSRHSPPQSFGVEAAQTQVDAEQIWPVLQDLVQTPQWVLSNVRSVSQPGVESQSPNPGAQAADPPTQIWFETHGGAAATTVFRISVGVHAGRATLSEPAGADRNALRSIAVRRGASTRIGTAPAVLRIGLRGLAPNRCIAVQETCRAAALATAATSVDSTNRPARSAILRIIGQGHFAAVVRVDVAVIESCGARTLASDAFLMGTATRAASAAIGRVGIGRRFTPVVEVTIAVGCAQRASAFAFFAGLIERARRPAASAVVGVDHGVGFATSRHVLVAIQIAELTGASAGAIARRTRTPLFTAAAMSRVFGRVDALVVTAARCGRARAARICVPRVGIRIRSATASTVWTSTTAAHRRVPTRTATAEDGFEVVAQELRAAGRRHREQTQNRCGSKQTNHGAHQNAPRTPADPGPANAPTTGSLWDGAVSHSVTPAPTPTTATT